MAGKVDALYIFLLLVCGVMTVLVSLTVIVFAVKYRKRPGHHAHQIEGSPFLEITWSIIPFGVFLIFFAWGAVIFFQERTPPRDSMEVYVVAKQWMWKFEHPEGEREINALHVPIGRDVKLIMTSQDVIHSFFVPAFRIKQDVLPGRYTIVVPCDRPGTYHLFCAEYCGTQHSGMIGDVVVMEPAQYEAWLSGGTAGAPLAEPDKNLFTQLGCSTCHRFDTQGRGPNLASVFGKQVLLEDGRTVVADENYVRESILNPGSKIVSGFKPIMPTFQGLVSDDQLNALVAYVKSLSQPAIRAGRRHRCRDQSATQEAAGAISMASVTTIPERDNYLTNGYGIKSWLLTTDHKRIAMLYLVSITLFFFIGGFFAMLIRLELLTPRGRPASGRHLQQGVHHARHDHGVLLPDPGRARRPGKFPGSDHDRRQGPGLPAHQPAELVPLHHRRHPDYALHADRRRRYRLDVLHALSAPRSPIPRSLKPDSRSSSRDSRRFLPD